jgi:hypothetical protein
MKKKMQRMTFVVIALACLLAITALSAVRPTDPRLEDAKRFSLRVSETGSEQPLQNDRPVVLPVGATNPAVVDSRGALIAQTWRDWQTHINAQNHVATNPVLSPAGPAGVHFVYTVRGNTATMNRWGYSAYDPGTGTFPIPGGKIIVNDDSPTSAELGEMPRVMVYPATGAAIVSGIDMTDYTNAGTWQIQTVFDIAPMAGNFGDIATGSIIDNTTALSGSWTAGDYNVRPQAALSVFGSDTNLYVATRGLTADANSNFAIKVFRKHGTSVPGFGTDPAWQLVFIDTSSNNSQTLAVDPLSTQVAVVWTKYANHDIKGATGDDVWYAKSPTGAVGTWTKTNLTNLTLSSNFAPWTLVSPMFDSQGKLHVVYPATVNEDGGTWNSIICKLWHWSEQDDSTWLVYDASWPLSTVCGRIGSNVMNVGRTAIAECDGKLYVTFSANDSTLTGHYDDCCKSQTFTYSGNAEVFMTVSKNLTGKSWDRPRNLSNSYTPNCDTGTCASDHFGSLTTFGSRDADFAGAENWTNAYTYDAGGGYTGDWYLQLLYSTDRYPGYGGAGSAYLGNPGDQGPNTLNDIRWIRLACVAPVMAAKLVLSPTAITFPEYSKPGQPKSFKIHMENQGNQDLAFTSVTDIEDSAKGVGAGPTNWMSISGVPSGIVETGRDSMTVTLNNGGVITSGPTVLYGKIRYQFTAPPQTTDFSVYFTVVDTIPDAVWDTISTACTDLAVGSNGNVGNSYGDSSGVAVGKVNLDYFRGADCDTGPNSRGDNRVYLGDGSPIVIRKPTPTTYRGSWSAFSADLSTPTSFKPATGGTYAPHGSFSTASYDGFNSGTFLTADSLIKLECTWWAPKHADSCNFVVQRTRIFPATIGNTIANLQIGEIVDFDIPTDSGTSNNISGTDPARRLVWMRGFQATDTTTDCIDNSKRYGGIALLNWHMKNKSCSDALYSGAAIANDVYVYPGVFADSLSRAMHIAGYGTESRITDQTILLTVQDGPSGFSLPANDTLTFYTAMATVRTSTNTAAGLDSLRRAIDKAKNFMKINLGYCASCCSGVTGNVNMTGIVDLSDLSALVSYLTGGGYVLPCTPEANVNNSGIVDLSDLSALVSYLTGGGYVLPNCG